MLTDAQYALISNTSFVYPTHPGTLIIPDGTTAHINSNMRITNTKELRIFREVMVVYQSLIQKIIVTVEDTYLADIRNRTTNSINNTVEDVLTHLKYNYGQLMPHKLLECKEKFNKTTYHPRKPIASVFSIIKEFREFADIAGTSYTHHQAINVVYSIIHRTGNFSLAICEFNCMPDMQNMWVGSKHLFSTAYRDL